MTTILITGASGRVARLLAPFLRDCPGVTIRWQSRKARGLEDSWIACDPLQDPDRMTGACAGCDAVVHLAGVTRADPVGLAALNVQLAHAVQTCARAAGVGRILAASSAAVYSPSGAPRSEIDPVGPTTPYGHAKLLTEQVLRNGQAADQQLCLMRIGNVLGADALMAGQPRPTLVDQFAGGRTPLRSYIAPSSLARVILRLATVPGVPTVLNVAAPRPVEMAELLTQAKLPWHPRPAPQDAVAVATLDTARLQSFVDWTAEPVTAADLGSQWLQTRRDRAA